MPVSGMPAVRLAAHDLDVLFQVRLGLSCLRVPVSRPHPPTLTLPHIMGEGWEGGVTNRHE